MVDTFAFAKKHIFSLKGKRSTPLLLPMNIGNNEVCQITDLPRCDSFQDIRFNATF
jgi:hypothetical protein